MHSNNNVLTVTDLKELHVGVFILKRVFASGMKLRP